MRLRWKNNAIISHGMISSVFHIVTGLSFLPGKWILKTKTGEKGISTTIASSRRRLTSSLWKEATPKIQCTNWRTIILHCFTSWLRSNTSLAPILQSPEILTLSRFQTKTASIFQFKTWMAFVLAFSWFKSCIQFEIENKQQAMGKKLFESLNSRF